MLKTFNAFQYQCMFVGMPFLISWLRTAEFQGHKLAMVIAGLVYFMQFVISLIITVEAFDDHLP